MYSPVISDYLADTISRNTLVIHREIIIIGARIKRFKHIGKNVGIKRADNESTLNGASSRSAKV